MLLHRQHEARFNFGSTGACTAERDPCSDEDVRLRHTSYSDLRCQRDCADGGGRLYPASAALYFPDLAELSSGELMAN